MPIDRWRVGRRNGHNVYRQHGDQPRGMEHHDGDDSLGYFRRPEDAQLAVDAVNAHVGQRDGGAAGDDTAPDWRDVGALVAYLSAKPDVAVVGGPVVPRGDVVNLLVGAPRAAAAPRAGDTTEPLSGAQVAEVVREALAYDDAPTLLYPEAVADFLSGWFFGADLTLVRRDGQPRAGADTRAEALSQMLRGMARRCVRHGRVANHIAVAADNERARHAADSVPRAPVEALLAALDDWARAGQQLIPIGEVRRHLD